MLLTTLLLLSQAQSATLSWQPQGSAVAAYEEARTTLNNGDPAAAEAQFRELLRKQPGCGLCSQGLGYSLLLQNRREEARDWLAEAAGRFPDQAPMQTALSEAAFAAQDFALAKHAAQAASRIDPTSLDAAMALQSVYLRTGDYDAADAALEAARPSLLPADAACLAVGNAVERADIPAATASLKSCQQSEREDVVTMVEGLYAQATGAKGEAAQLMGALGVESVRLISAAIDAYNGGDPQTAITVLDEVIAKNPDRLDAYLMRGQARFRVGDKVAARQDLERAFAGGAWVEVHSTGMMSGILRKSDEEKLSEMVLNGAAMLTLLSVEAGDTKRARAVLDRAKKEGRRNNDLLAAEVELLAAEGRRPEAWKLIANEIAKGNKGATLLDEAGALAWKDLAGAPAPVLAAIRSDGSGAARYNVASAMLNAGRSKDCSAEVAATPALARSAMPALDRVALDRLGYRCAVYAEDLSAADARLASLNSLSGVEFAAGFNHASMLLDKDRAADALRVLDLLEAHDAASRSKENSLAINANIALAQWSRATALAGGEDVAAADQAFLAFKLNEAGQVGEARVLLLRACPKLSGDEAAQCKALLAEVGG